MTQTKREDDSCVEDDRGVEDDKGVRESGYEIVKTPLWSKTRITLGQMQRILARLEEHHSNSSNFTTMIAVLNDTTNGIDKLIARHVLRRRNGQSKTTAIVFIADCVLQTVCKTEAFNHWYIVVIDPQGSTTIVDSKNPPSLASPTNYGTLMREWVQGSKHCRVYTGHQKDADSCGYWAIFYAVKLLTEHQLRPEQLPQLRCTVEDAYEMYANL